MADAGLRHVLVVDGQRRLSGIIAQSDLIAALYRGRIQAYRPQYASRAA
jgi:CBS domain-containing membrane protein